MIRIRVYYPKILQKYVKHSLPWADPNYTLILYRNVVIVGDSTSSLEKIDCSIFLLITTAVINFAFVVVSNYFLDRIPAVLLQHSSANELLPNIIEVYRAVNIFNTNSLATFNPTFIPIIWLPISNDNKILIVVLYKLCCCTLICNLKHAVNTTPLFLILYLLKYKSVHCAVILCSYRKHIYHSRTTERIIDQLFSKRKCTFCIMSGF